MTLTERGPIMSRLDRHVSHVQNKLALRKFVDALAWMTLFIGIAVVLGVLAWKIFGIGWRPSAIWWLIGGGAAVAGVAIFSLVRRPSLPDAPMAIDSQLSLTEK